MDTTDNAGNTPLHWAARRGYKELANLLLAKGAAVDATANDGSTAAALGSYRWP